MAKKTYKYQCCFSFLHVHGLSGQIYACKFFPYSFILYVCLCTYVHTGSLLSSCNRVLYMTWPASGRVCAEGSRSTACDLCRSPNMSGVLRSLLWQRAEHTTDLADERSAPLFLQAPCVSSADRSTTSAISDNNNNTWPDCRMSIIIPKQQRTDKVAGDGRRAQSYN